MKDAIIFLSVTCYVAILLLFLFQPIYKRLESEKTEKNQNQEASIMIDSTIKNEDEENESLTTSSSSLTTSSSSSFGDSIG
jgi:cytoskeletal protein RodZ